MKKKLILGIFVIGIFFCSLLIKTQAITTSFKSEDQTTESSNISLSPISPKLVDLSRVPHEPIEIMNDGNFTDYSFPGTGDEGTPFIIEGYNIITTSENGIYIYNTTKYFIINDCYVDAEKHGIYIRSVAGETATIINNTVINNKYGIFLGMSIGSTLTNNTCTNNWSGIYLTASSPSCTLSNNTCTNNTYSGIYMSASNTTLTDNTCTNSGYGFYLYSSFNSSLINNTCIDNSYGFRIVDSSGSTIIDNSFSNDGLYIIESSIEDYLTYTIENNWVNGKEFGYYINLDKITLSEALFGQLFLVNCSEVKISNQIISNTSISLHIRWCENAILTNNTFTDNNYIGIYLYYSPRSTLTDNTCKRNRFGIYLDTSYDSTLNDNRCVNNSWNGIYIQDSENSFLVNNVCNNNNKNGIKLYFSSGSTVSDNICNNNYWHGIYLEFSSSTTISHNIFINNTGEGILLSASDSCLITYNLLQENKLYGIGLFSGSVNIIHHNTFIDNNLKGTIEFVLSQARDNSASNTWYETSSNEGNYWSDWSGTGSYPIDGIAGSVDPYPLGEPSVAEFTNGFNLLILVFVLGLAIIPVSLITRRRLKDR
ncbi:MAG: right-handed parallel beta-helix repeat-containing protein [Candidatus Heimdallarchaeota archaeon]|nr:right-handed parallel beta-helix repeat-containing protein [Candidatus Heimdallarchaeota archaeon]MCK4876411.1 right-handed parallel beta-helix repeat-containing protein [Candidatus Heimdallarchaeota archaeon]